jgi:hypothetical protein
VVQKWTKPDKTDLSANCQKRTHVPQQTSPLFDHLVGATDERVGNIDAERFGDLQVDDEIELSCPRSKDTTIVLT